MQAQLLKVQEEVGNKMVTASAGGGMVEATVSGKLELVSLRISPEVIHPEETEMLEDLVVAAVNEALRKAQEMVNNEMAKVTSGIKLPGLT